MKNTRKELMLFFTISFGWMWLINLPCILAAFEVIIINPVVSMIMGYITVFSPGIAAFMLTAKFLGREGVRKLWKRASAQNFKKKWLFPALFLVPLSALMTLGVLSLIDIPIQWEYSLPPAMILPISLLIWLLGAYPEEYGWRGFALPRLLENRHPLSPTLILGIIWGFWHLPPHFIPTTT